MTVSSLGGRISSHPILDIPKKREIHFLWEGKTLSATEGEVISSALIAQGINCFGHHHRDGAPQGIFCANGQCSHCLVIADGVPVKACMTLTRDGMDIRPANSLPELPPEEGLTRSVEVPEESTDVLIAGGGPAGLNAALELARNGVDIIVCDDKSEIGGKLTLQTHNFFGSVRECYAGTRGISIARKLAGELQQFKNVKLWLNSPVVGVFSDGKFGVINNGRYTLIKPRQFLAATGAREKALAFEGHDLPGVFGAGAFQTLVNRDLVRPSSRVFIIGGGNVGLIAAYHAVQAGIHVVGLVEAMPKVGGYTVHLDKIKRLGIPVFTSHTVIKVSGNGRVEKVVIAGVDEKFRPIGGTERSFLVDTVLVAVGLNSVNELTQQAREMGIETYEAGDAELIAEASAAMFSGMVTARRMLQALGRELCVPKHWSDMLATLRRKAGPIHDFKEPENEAAKVFPVIRCVQEIPCNPCVEACPKGWIRLESENILSLPHWEKECIGCLKCAVVCPGLAITVVDRRFDSTGRTALVWIPWELDKKEVSVGHQILLTGFEGEEVGWGTVRHIRSMPWMDKRKMVQVEVYSRLATKVAGIRIQEPEYGSPVPQPCNSAKEEVMVCLCERVRWEEIARLVRLGLRDLNAIKAATRCGMGACNGKTCENLVKQVLIEEGVSSDTIVGYVKRPLMMELPLTTLLKKENE